MNCDVVFGLVDDIDDESIAIIDLQCRPWELPVHGNGIVGFAQPLHWRGLNLHCLVLNIKNSNGRK